MILRYTLPEMGAVWSDTARFEAMLRVELAVARAQAVRGQVPPEALAALESRARVDVARITEIEKATDHDVIAFVSQVAEAVGAEGRYLHLGLTSSDVVDTGLALQLRVAGGRLLGDVDRLLAVLIARARSEAATVMMGHLLRTACDAVRALIAEENATSIALARRVRMRMTADEQDGEQVWLLSAA